MSWLSRMTGVDIKVSKGRLVRFKVGESAMDALCLWLDKELSRYGVSEAIRAQILDNLRRLGV